MARLEGTGKDPLGRYGKGEMFDVPEGDPLYDELIEKKYAKVIEPEDDPARSKTQIADAVVSGQPLTDPVDQKVAEELQGREHDVVLTGDPDAKAGDAGLSPDEDSPDDARRVSPEEVTERSQSNIPRPASSGSTGGGSSEEAEAAAEQAQQAADTAEKAAEQAQQSAEEAEKAAAASGSGDSGSGS